MLRMTRFIMLCLGAMFMANAAHAADTKIPNPVIAIIDVQRILSESLAAKNVQKQLEARRAKFQSETQGEENELRKSEQELSKQRSKLAADIYADREQQLNQRFLAVERHVQSRRKLLDQAFTESMNAVRAGLLDIVADLAHERGVNLVLVKQQALWVDAPMDVTDEVLARLNAKLPQVAIKMAPEDKP
jgi:outer membrane protein